MRQTSFASHNLFFFKVIFKCLFFNVIFVMLLFILLWYSYYLYYLLFMLILTNIVAAEAFGIIAHNCIEPQSVFLAI